MIIFTLWLRLYNELLIEITPYISGYSSETKTIVSVQEVVVN